MIDNADKLVPDFFLDDAPPVTPEELKKTLAGGSAGTSGIVKIFDAIEKKINPELVKKVQGVYLFQVTGLFLLIYILHLLFMCFIVKMVHLVFVLFPGAEEGLWHLDLKNGSGSSGKGKPVAAPDCTLSMDSKNFTDMFSGM